MSAWCAACDFLRSGADFGPKFSKIFAAAKFCVRNRARSRRNPCRLVVHSLLATLRVSDNCCECQHAVPRAISCDLDSILELISDRNLFEIARDRAAIHAAWWCTASPRPLEVPNLRAERRHTAAGEIACDFRPKISIGIPHRTARLRGVSRRPPDAKNER